MATPEPYEVELAEENADLAVNLGLMTEDEAEEYVAERS